MNRVIGLLPILVVIAGGCSSSSTKVPGKGSGDRNPAQDYAYPLNPQFETAMPHEAENLAQIRDGILKSQAKVKGQEGHYLRGTHAKGTCLEGTLAIDKLDATLPPEIATRLQKGIFSVPGSYDTDVRFANADGTINSDDHKDVRAVSLSVHMPPELSNALGLMDFTFNNATTFPINDSQAFANIEDMSHPFQSIKEGGLKEEGQAALDIADGLLIQEQEGKVPYQKMHYWSTVPFALGATEAVKYKLNPCSANQAQPLVSSDTNKLQDELKRHVNNDSTMSCFDFQVQPLEPAKMTFLFRLQPASWWVENAAVEWNEGQAPFYKVGRLTLKAKSIATDEVCSSRWVSVFEHGNLMHHGLGSINRVREAAEKASKEVRLEH